MSFWNDSMLIGAGAGGLKVQDVFNISLWTGTGVAQTITTGIDSDDGSLVWIKNRNLGRNNVLYDTERGAGAYLISNSTNEQFTNLDMLSDFGNSDYSLGTNSSVNAASDTYVGWQFRRAEKFFDIVQYTGDGVAGRQIAHNLGVVPGMIIIKRLNIASNWRVYHRSAERFRSGVLHAPFAFDDGTSFWNFTDPTDEVFTVGDHSDVNGSGSTYIAYIFAHDPSPEGFIQCGSYTGNGTPSGPVIDLGWEPQFLFLKCITSTGDWFMLDTERGWGSGTSYLLLANSQAAETTVGNIIPLPTGFQIATASGNWNSNGQIYGYMAIREPA